MRSPRLVAQWLRIFDIHDHVEGKLKQVMQDCKCFSLPLDESTDVMDVSQLLIFTRTVDSVFEVHEDLFKMMSLHDIDIQSIVNQHTQPQVSH